jgi:hypothetical protein
MPFTGRNKAHSRLILFPSTGLSVSAKGCFIRSLEHYEEMGALQH